MKKFKHALLIVVATMLVMCNSLIVFAASNEEIQSWVNANGTRLSMGDSMANDLSTNQSDADPSQLQFNYNGKTYWLTSHGKSTVEANISAAASNAQQNQEVANVISGINTNLGLKPDTATALGGLSGFIPAINLILGIIVAIITAGMTLLTACDILYISFPPFRGKCESAKANGTGVDQGRSAKAGETRLKFISDEAEFAVNSAETVQTGKSPLIIYGKKRALAIVLTTVVLFILVTGNIDVVTKIALKAVSGIINIIQQIGA